MSSIPIRIIGAEKVEEKLISIAENIPSILDYCLNKSAGLIYQSIRDKTPVRTGETVKTLEVKEEPGKRIVGSNSPVYVYLEYGTSPHEIYPVKALALRWEDIYGVHFAKHVHHPGTRPLHIFRRSVEENRGEIVKIFINALAVKIK